MLLRLMTLIPKRFVRPIAANYIAGETIANCIARGADLNADGWKLIIDVLGEHSNESEAVGAVEHYRTLIREASGAGLNFGLSLKLSHIGGAVSEELGAANLKLILETAREHGLHLTIDMENATTTDATFRTYETLMDDFDLGCVVQAYLKRSQADVERILTEHDHKRVKVRVCKGIYKESPNLLVGGADAIRDNYICLAQTLYDRGAYVCVATHDETIISHIENAGWAPDRFEFQILLGVPVYDHMRQLREKGFTTTAYVPFGPEWYAYSMRRLAENPTLIRYVIGNLFKRN